MQNGQKGDVQHHSYLIQVSPIISILLLQRHGMSVYPIMHVVYANQYVSYFPALHLVNITDFLILTNEHTASLRAVRTPG